MEKLTATSSFPPFWPRNLQENATRSPALLCSPLLQGLAEALTRAPPTAQRPTEAQDGSSQSGSQHLPGSPALQDNPRCLGLRPADPTGGLPEGPRRAVCRRSLHSGLLFLKSRASIARCLPAGSGHPSRNPSLQDPGLRHLITGSGSIWPTSEGGDWKPDRIGRC